jgi:hypothetical protein
MRLHPLGLKEIDMSTLWDYAWLAGITLGCLFILVL